MRKIFGIMIAMGLILAMITAGSADANTMTVSQLACQGAAASLLVLMGTHFLLRGEKI